MFLKAKKDIGIESLGDTRRDNENKRDRLQSVLSYAAL